MRSQPFYGGPFSRIVEASTTCSRFVHRKRTGTNPSAKRLAASLYSHGKPYPRALWPPLRSPATPLVERNLIGPTI